MKKYAPLCLFLFLLIILSVATSCRSAHKGNNSGKFSYDSSQPWAYWYWMHGAYSEEGITADLEAMKEAGLAGAYLMSIKGPTEEPLIDPPIIQTTPEWWEMVKHAMNEADRLDLKLAMHSCDGFAVAGGPWITPDISMQKVVWSEMIQEGGKVIQTALPQPEIVAGHYRDIAVFAFPVKTGNPRKSGDLNPKISSNEGEDVSFLLDDSMDGSFSTNDEAWIQYEFDEPFTARSIRIKTSGNSYQAHRLIIEKSDDGIDFQRVTRLNPPRHGWQDWDFDYTHSIESTTARFFRFIYEKEGTEPGAEDLDAAKWKPSLKIRTLELSEHARINQYEGKSGAVWRISERSTDVDIPTNAVVSKEELINISDKMSGDGNLLWHAPEGDWMIMRFGHTSTGHTNATGGGGKGLEVDKFNTDALRFQFDQWFGEALRTAGPDLAESVLKILHIDSWEAGSQNWSPVFSSEFKERRGYDILDYLPVFAGVPIESAEASEKILFDIRKTISELVVDKFFVTMAEEAHKNGVEFSAENVAPTMMSDGLLHFKYVDLPGGEFWLNSPTHDKPNDIRDAISGGHIYGKQIIQAEAFTQLRMDWDEHPGNIKVVGDRNYALGINRFFYHVFVHNPWLDRKPGMTLDAIGLYFQRDQTWWEPGKAWVDYAQRTQYHLQKGHPVVDLAVFAGEEIPNRSVLPERLLPFLPGIFGEETVRKEAERRANIDQPTTQRPKGVTYSANMATAEDWTDPLKGYQYDSFNADVLLNLAQVRNGRVELPGGASYALLVFPGNRKMNPHAYRMSVQVATKILELVKSGATVLVDEKATHTLGYTGDHIEQLETVMEELWQGYNENWNKDDAQSWQVGQGRVVKLPYHQATFEALGLQPDFVAKDASGKLNEGIAFTHRRSQEEDIYFISNQREEKRVLNLSFRISGKEPVFYDPVWDRYFPVKQWKIENGRTVIPVELVENESLFVIFRENTDRKEVNMGSNITEFNTVANLDNTWTIDFDETYRGPKKPLVWNKLQDWTAHENDSVKYYSGTAEYTTSFQWEGERDAALWLDLGKVANLAAVRVNGLDCGVAWTYPYRVDITDAIKPGQNRVEIAVTNTWANRIIGDFNLPEEDRLTRSLAPLERIKNNPLQEAGLIGPVKILKRL
ncbi:glycosyl hydrolase [Anditalea andensis]|uniref:DNA-binding protein n=1 Tax=Anditalea andensis TaxID=1048983 RepID=A0A074L330_9BACT|nr:glycosyl hydrolase [Anditalea andensis]KEO74278.1 DNA-binding protein [Anditalea andensis]